MNNVVLDILKYIVDSSKEGDFIIIEYDDIKRELKTVNDLTSSAITDAIKYLKINNYVTIKFQQDETIVVKPTADGYSVFREDEVQNTQVVRSVINDKKSSKNSMFSHILAGAIGGLFSGGLITAILFIVKWQIGW